MNMFLNIFKKSNMSETPFFFFLLYSIQFDLIYFWHHWIELIETFILI